MKLFVRLSSVLVCVAALVVFAWNMRGSGSQAGGVNLVSVGEELERILRKNAGEGGERDPARTEETASTEAEPPGGTWLPERRPLDPELTATLHPMLTQEARADGGDPRKVYDPLAYFVNAPGWTRHLTWREHPKGRWIMSYSQAGFRNPYEPAEVKPAVRVIVCGDSHIEGVVPYEETVAGLLERVLRGERADPSVEVLNGASGGYDFYHYLGFLERSLPLRPDVYLLIIYGGNDFMGFLGLHAYYERIVLEGPGRRLRLQMVEALKRHGNAVAQSFSQITNFVARPAHIELALDGSVRIMREIDLICRREGIALLAAYLPPMHDVRPQDMEAALRDLVQIFDLDADDLAVTDRMADRFLAELSTHGIDTIDLRPPMAAARERLFWHDDHHLNTHGQRLVARELLPHLRPLLPPSVDARPDTPLVGKQR